MKLVYSYLRIRVVIIFPFPLQLIDGEGARCIPTSPRPSHRYELLTGKHARTQARCETVHVSTYCILALSVDNV